MKKKTSGNLIVHTGSFIFEETLSGLHGTNNMNVECFWEILWAAIINIDISQGHVSSEQRLGIQILVDYLQNGYLCLLTQQSNNMDMSNLDVQLEKEIWTHLQGFISTLFPFPDTKLLKNGAVGII